jgi:beta-galactosidase GanA
MIRTMLAALLLLGSPAVVEEPLPHLEGRHLIVDGKPWLLLGGELANSSASSRAYMASRWDSLAALHLNTVLMPVSWELIEPEEGRFDFVAVDGLLADARAHDLRVVLLWFGSWKNSMSSYAPAWVKRDGARFPRARTADGAPIEMLSPFAPANRQADAHAFAALMAHLAETDPERTVLMVQVENEIGMIPEPRDHSPPARAAWGEPVPEGLPGAGKSWAEAYGG